MIFHNVEFCFGRTTKKILIFWVYSVNCTIRNNLILVHSNIFRTENPLTMQNKICVNLNFYNSYVVCNVYFLSIFCLFEYYFIRKTEKKII